MVLAVKPQSPSAPCAPTHIATDRQSLLVVCWRQWQTEQALRRRGIGFRTTDPAEARRAYSEMTSEEFAAINGRQAWANRRTIVRSLRGLLPARPVFAIDLGCGIGESTRVLAALLPAGSRLVGVEFAAPLAELSRARSYRGSDGRPADVRIVVGSVTETFRDDRGERIPTGSVDVVNASGIIGHHLAPPEAERACEEVARVLRPGGIAALDVGPKLRDADLTAVMREMGFGRVRRTRSNPFDRTGQVVFRKGG